MNKKPSIDREFLIPILISGFSLIGIVIILVVGRALSSPAQIAATPSATPFQYIYLGTEPAITTLVVEGSELPPTEAPVTEAPFVTPGRPTVPPPIFDTPAQPSTSPPFVLPSKSTTVTAITSASRTPSRVPSATRTSTASPANTYDDTDSRLTYSGSWTSQSGVSGAYQDTLHISNTIGNLVSFTFSGQEIHFFYQAGQSLGTVTIFIDDDTLGITVSEAQGGEWTHTLEAGTHNIVIRHTSGGSVNVDRLVIPAPTPTPTRTPKP